MHAYVMIYLRKNNDRQKSNKERRKLKHTSIKFNIINNMNINSTNETFTSHIE